MFPGNAGHKPFVRNATKCERRANAHYCQMPAFFQQALLSLSYSVTVHGRMEEVRVLIVPQSGY